MADAQRDFWPDIAVLELVSTPLTLLKEQATALARKTKGLLEGRIHTTNRIGTTDRIGEFTHSFAIVAPTLDNYSYELFRVAHGVSMYPARIEVSSSSRFEVKTEQEFVDALKQVLSSPETMRVISALLAQAKS
jgi:hypothetical protein